MQLNVQNETKKTQKKLKHHSTLNEFVSKEDGLQNIDSWPTWKQAGLTTFKQSHSAIWHDAMLS